MANDALPLFPLNLVLLPEEILPLHIFEPRYKEMIGECWETNCPFGIVLAEEGEFRSTGCLARIIEVTEEFQDGRMNILTQGGERFRVLNIHRKRSYLTAEVEHFDDSPEKSLSSELINNVITATRKMLKETEYFRDEIWQDPKRLSFLAGTVFKLSNREKQILLEFNSARERLKFLTLILEGQSDVLQKKSALRNGRPRR